MEKVIIIACMVWAVYITMTEGMIFERLGYAIERIAGDYWAKPLATCPICMGGIYGAVLYWLIYGHSVKEWLVVNIAVIGLNTIIIKLAPDK